MNTKNPLASYELSGSISEHEWRMARPCQQCVIDRWYYNDVGTLIAPGGTGKTTFILFQAIQLVLGNDLFGHEIRHSGNVIIITAEDSRETLVARLRQMSTDLDLSEEAIAIVKRDILITDVSGKHLKLTRVTQDVVEPAREIDYLIAQLKMLYPALIFIDPMVSFGVGESRVNDAEQGLIEAGRRIRNETTAAVIYVHHTGKVNARGGSRDQYSGRGGSALADGCRMVHVLQRLSPDEWTEKTGDVLGPDETGLVLSRPKMTWCPPQPDIYIKRTGYLFIQFAEISPEDGGDQEANAVKIWQFLIEEYQKGIKYSGRTLEAKRIVVPQKAFRNAIKLLKDDGRIVEEQATTGGRGGARSFLCPMQMQIKL